MAALHVGEISNEQVVAMAHTRGVLIEWSVGNEVHPEPADPNKPNHKHFYLHYANAINHRDSRYCTLFYMIGRNGRLLHPEIQGVGPSKKDRINVIRYTQKDNDYIASPNLINFDAEYEQTSTSWALEMNKAPTVRAGMLELQQRHPHIFYMNAQRVEAGLQMRISHSQPSQFKLEDFKCAPFTPAELESKAIVIQGASHIGKTQWALAHFEYPLVVSEIDDLQGITLRTDGLVFDQMRFIHPEDTRKLNMSADAIIKLLDMELERSISARYKNARVPAKMPRIFTTNRRVTDGEPIFPFGCNREEQEGIDSRIIVTEWLDQDLRKNPAPTARGVRRERDLPMHGVQHAAAAAAGHPPENRRRVMVQSDEAHMHVHEYEEHVHEN